MKYLFTLQGSETLESFCSANPLFAFDFDGTLVGIVNDPDQVRMNPHTVSLLRALNKVAPVAIISGRSLKDLRSFLSFPLDLLAGNHGLEGVNLPEEQKAAWPDLCCEWKHQLAESMPPGLLKNGVRIEDKTVTLAIHYRMAKKPLTTKNAIINIVTGIHPPPRIVFGKKVVNLLPPGLWHKGTTLLHMMQKMEVKRAIYVGDDDTDEDVFSLGDPRILTVRIGFHGFSNAQFYLHRQLEVNTFLRACLHHIKPGMKVEKEKPLLNAQLPHKIS
jgi:trehalose 6-phosphate phosphatase